MKHLSYSHCLFKDLIRDDCGYFLLNIISQTQIDCRWRTAIVFYYQWFVSWHLRADVQVGRSVPSGCRCCKVWLHSVFTSYYHSSSLAFSTPGMSGRLKGSVEGTQEELGLSAISQRLLTWFNDLLIEKLSTTGNQYLLSTEVSSLEQRWAKRNLSGLYTF